MPVRPLLWWLFRGWGGRQGLVHDVLAQEDDVGLSRAEVADLWQATPGFEAVRLEQTQAGVVVSEDDRQYVADA